MHAQTTVPKQVLYYVKPGLEIATNTVANATNFSSLATKIVVSRHFGDLNFAWFTSTIKH